MTTTIKIENLGKRYLIRHQAKEPYSNIREVLVQKLKHATNRLIHPKKYKQTDLTREDLWAIRNIDLEIKKGEKIGIIGRNGAGKTTLLKVLSRITEPTQGKITLHGRVASLLEVGTGFHPELTGRENIFFNGAVLGMGKKEIQKKFDEIVAFAEVEKFLDTPVKRYSSGMYVRLAFAVAAHLEPEVLLVDEVLAVGDVSFQRKCLGKMKEVSQSGRTVFFVSHNMQAVQTLCNKVAYLDNGKLIKYGPTRDVVNFYLKKISKAKLLNEWKDGREAPGNDSIRLKSVKLFSGDQLVSKEITVKTPLTLEFEYWNLKPNICLNLFVPIYNLEGACIFVTSSTKESNWQGKSFPKGLFKSCFHIPANLLNAGSFIVHVKFVKDTSIVLYEYSEALIFDVNDVTDRGMEWHGKWVGAVRPELKWKTVLLDRKN